MQRGGDPYRLLGVPRQAGVEEIKRAYRRAALRYHPDTYKGDPAEGARIFREMTEAYKVIIRSALLAARAARLRQRGRSPEDLARRDLRWLSAGAGAGAWQKPSGRRRSRLRRSGRRAGKDLIVALLAATLAFGALGAAVVFWVVSEGDQGDQWTDYRTDDAEWGALGGACVLWLGVGVGSGCLLVVLLRKWRSRGEY